MKLNKPRLFRVIIVIVLVYVIGAFVLTPPNSPRGIFAVYGGIDGHRAFVTIEQGSLMMYISGYNVHYSLGQVTMQEEAYALSRRGGPPVALHFTAWGLQIGDGMGSERARKESEWE